MSIVEFDEPPSWSPNASETGEITKCLWVVTVKLIARGCHHFEYQIGKIYYIILVVIGD